MGVRPGLSLFRQVARIQLSILETLKLLAGSADITAAIGLLNAELMDISTLYGDFAEPFGLAESKLAIVHCAGHYDPTLVESLWRDIIDDGGCRGVVLGSLSGW